MSDLLKQVVQPQEELYRLIPLTQNQFAIVDIADYDIIAQWKWFAIWDKDTRRFYAGRKEKCHVIRMHRQIMGSPNGKDVDHKNLNSLDNRRDNLRVCSRSQNMANGRKYVSNTSGYRGVIFDQRAKLWRSRITIMQKRISLGYSKTAAEAARRYDRKAIELFGDFARTNFPRSDYD